MAILPHALIGQLEAICGIVILQDSSYSSAVIHLTKQEQKVLCVVLLLLLLGWSVKTYRTAHPPSQPELTKHDNSSTNSVVVSEKSNP